MDDKVRTLRVVEGEASESDVENEEMAVSKKEYELVREPPPIGFNTLISIEKSSSPMEAEQRSFTRYLEEQDMVTSGILVSGEASESEDDDNLVNTLSSSAALQLSPPLKIDSSLGLTNNVPTAYQTTTAPEKLVRSDSLLHKKLRETNDRLKCHIQNFKSKQFENASQELRTISMQLVKTQTITKEISTSMRMISNDLFQLEDKLDIVTSCTLIPCINIVPDQTQSKSPLFGLVSRASSTISS